MGIIQTGVIEGKQCKMCGMLIPLFMSGINQRKYCSDICRERAHHQGIATPRQRIVKITQLSFVDDRYCETCGEHLDPSRSRYLQRKYCSTTCLQTGVVAKTANKQRRIDLKKAFVELFGGACCYCGYHEYLSAFEFHHIDPKQKDGNPGGFIYSGDFDLAYAELDKCALLCRNCHMAWHASEWSGAFIKREGIGWAIDCINA